MKRIVTNKDGEMHMYLTTLEIEWLDVMEGLDDENLAAVFVAWEIESTDRMSQRMERKENG